MTYRRHDSCHIEDMTHDGDLIRFSISWDASVVYPRVCVRLMRPCWLLRGLTARPNCSTHARSISLSLSCVCVCVCVCVWATINPPPKKTKKNSLTPLHRSLFLSLALSLSRSLAPLTPRQPRACVCWRRI